MSFPHAKKGIKKLFLAEIFALISVIGTVLVLIVEAIGDRLTNSNVGMAIMIAMLVCFAVTSVMSVVALILNMVGVIQTAKDEPFFKIVIYVTAFGLAVLLASVIFGMVTTTENQALSNISQVVIDIVNTVTTALIVMGICNMAEKCSDTAVFNRGQVLFRVIIMIALFSLFTRAIAAFIPNTATVVIEILLFIASGILTIVQYIMYLVFLHKASKMLKLEYE